MGRARDVIPPEVGGEAGLWEPQCSAEGRSGAGPAARDLAAGGRNPEKGVGGASPGRVPRRGKEWRGPRVGRPAKR